MKVLCQVKKLFFGFYWLCLCELVGAESAGEPGSAIKIWESVELGGSGMIGTTVGDEGVEEG